jgi:hypothetical protein
MRHEYVGDVGDFGKYALLTALCKDLRLGVVWYLNDRAESNNDGSFTNYNHLRSCDPSLHDKLLQIVRGQKRSLKEIEDSAVLPAETLFYREPMPYSEKPCFNEASRARETSRRYAWLEGAYCALSKAELVFLDPDNGLAGSTIKTYSRKSPKYAFSEEVNGWLDRGKSVVLYQHQQRRSLNEHAQEQIDALGKIGCSGWALTFHRMAVRIYFVLPADEHRMRLIERTKEFLATEWGMKRHFRVIAGCLS